MKIREIKDYFTIQISGEKSWESAKESIWNIFYKGYSQDGKFVIDVSNTYESPGFFTVVNSRKDLQNKLDFVEKRHIKGGRIFNFHFHNLYFVEAEENILEKPIREKIKGEIYALAA